MIHNSCLSAHTQKCVENRDFSHDMTYIREVTKLTIITLAYIDYFLLTYIGLHGVMDVIGDFEPMCPGFESRAWHDFFFFFFFFGFFLCFYFFFFVFFFVFFCHYYYSANWQIQHYCLYSVSPTLLLLMMPRPPAPSAL